MEHPQFFHQSRPLSIRLWHWLTLFFLLGTLTTVILGSTIFRTRNNTHAIQEWVLEKGGTITEQQARFVAHEYSDKLWMFHKYIGYGLCILLAWRVVTEVNLSKEKKLGSKIRMALSYPKGPEQQHNAWVQYGYLIFYTLFITMALTGLVLAYEDQKWLDPIHELAKTLHEYIQYGIYAYMIFHLIGVIRADLYRYPGIVSRMIHGKGNQD